MKRTLLNLYDTFKAHGVLCALSLLLLTALLTVSLLRLTYQEDISDFLPLEGEDREALTVYQHLAGADHIVVSFGQKEGAVPEPDRITGAIDRYVALLRRRDTAGWVQRLVYQADLSEMAAVQTAVYRHMPYFMTESDYARADSLLSLPDYVAGQLERDRQMLSFPVGGFLSAPLSQDPLNLFAPVVERLQGASPQASYEIYDGYIFTPDMKRGLLTLTSRFGPSETEQNPKLIALLESVGEEVSRDYAEVGIHLTGGPVIAVGNARQIKADTVWSVALSVTLILLLLWFSLRSVRNILLIAVSIGWGWIFAMGGLALFRDEVSLIVLGISSVILGIAVNYPLHLIAHLNHTPDTRTALREIAVPLVVGNVTTVGAFLSLVPLQSVSLRDLGLFSSFLLIGTILFVLLYLPHAVAKSPRPPHPLFEKAGQVVLDRKPWLVVTVVLLTGVWAYFSTRTTFEAQMSSINYMTEEQQADLKYFSALTAGMADADPVYVVSTDSTLDGALDRSRDIQPRLTAEAAQRGWTHSGCTAFLSSQQEQAVRLARWHQFKERHARLLNEELRRAMQEQGFSAHSFDDFFALLDRPFQPEPFSTFAPVADLLFARNLSLDSVASVYRVVDILSVPATQVKSVRQELSEKYQDQLCFDIGSVNEAMTTSLSDDFNYIGWACGTIVFLFLWFSFGSFELAVLSFIPMGISWIWILGIMGLFDIHFNIVNVILATFIFGQGDDYTIFMTEGSSYEYTYRRKMLASYKNSIILSALIMFIGIGTLVFARHPALFSLAQVTIIGMFTVVFMAYLFPPYFYRLLVQKGDRYRERPLSLGPVLRGVLFRCIEGAAGLCSRLSSGKNTPQPHLGQPARLRESHRVNRWAAFLFRVMPGVRLSSGFSPASWSALPPVWLCSQATVSDRAVWQSLGLRLLFVTPQSGAQGPRCYPSVSLQDLDVDRCRAWLSQGYRLCFLSELPDSGRPEHLSWNVRVFQLLRALQLEVLPLYLHGTASVFDTESLMIHRGTLHVAPLAPIPVAGLGDEADALKARVETQVAQQVQRLKSQWETPACFRAYLLDRYRYKGADVYRAVRKHLQKTRCYASVLDRLPACSSVQVLHDEYGDFSLLLALTHRDTKVYCLMDNEDSARLLTYSAEGCAPNLQVCLTTEPQSFAVGAEPSLLLTLHADGLQVKVQTL